MKSYGNLREIYDDVERGLFSFPFKFRGEEYRSGFEEGVFRGKVTMSTIVLFMKNNRVEVDSVIYFTRGGRVRFYSRNDQSSAYPEVIKELLRIWLDDDTYSEYDDQLSPGMIIEKLGFELTPALYEMIQNKHPDLEEVLNYFDTYVPMETYDILRVELLELIERET